MSRVGKVPVKTQGAQVQVQGQKITIKGPKGEQSLVVPDVISIAHANDEIVLKPLNNSKQARALWGTARANLNNIVKGTKDGFVINLELFGTGYRASVNGQLLSLTLGYSHEIKFGFPKNISIKCASPTEVEVSGSDKQLVGQIAAEIRSYRKPEPYKGKGVKRKGEYVRRKEGKKK